MTEYEQEFEEWYEQLSYLLKDYQDDDPEYREAHRLWLLGYSPEDANVELRVDEGVDPFDE